MAKQGEFRRTLLTTVRANEVPLWFRGFILNGHKATIEISGEMIFIGGQAHYVAIWPPELHIWYVLQGDAFRVFARY